MTIYIQNTVVTNTFDFWRNRTNELASAMSNSVVTVNSNTAVGNAAISDTFTANNLILGNTNPSAYILIGNTTVNAYVNTSSISFGNSSVNTTITTSTVVLANSVSNLNITIPTNAQYSNGQYYLNANGSWSIIAPPETATQTLSTTGTGTMNLDSFSTTTYNVAEYILSVKDNNANNYFTGKFIVAHDSGTAYITQYATFTSNSSVGTFASTLSSGNVYFRFTPTSSNTTVKYFRSIV